MIHDADAHGIYDALLRRLDSQLDSGGCLSSQHLCTYIVAGLLPPGFQLQLYGTDNITNAPTLAYSDCIKANIYRHRCY